VELQPACESDAHALIPALESTVERGLVPAQVLADSLYGSDENSEKAKEMGVEVVSPSMGAQKYDTFSPSQPLPFLKRARLRLARKDMPRSR